LDIISPAELKAAIGATAVNVAKAGPPMSVDIPD